MIYKNNRPEEIFGKAIGQLIHDLRNSLNTVIGFSSILRVDENINKENRTLLNKIYLSGLDIEDHLMNIDHYMIESNEIMTKKENFEIYEFLKEYFKNKKEILDEKQINLNLLNEMKIEINFSKEVFSRIIDNLLRVSFKGLQSSKVKEIELCIKNNNGKLLIIYTDSSSPVFIESNYFSFEEVMKSGRGLGLLFVEKYVVLNNGEINYLYGNKWTNFITNISTKIKNTHGFKIMLPF